MRRLVLFALMTLMVGGVLSLVSCKKQGNTTTTTADTTTSPVATDTTLQGSGSAQSGSAAQSTDTTHAGGTSDAGGTSGTTGTSGTPGTTGTTGTRETTTAAPTTTAVSGDKGIGPVTTITLGAIDNNLATEGHQLYNSKCLGCHKLDAKGIGPALRNITKELTPEYIMNIMLNTKEMEAKNARAKQLVAQTGKQMPAVKLTQDQARSILEYLRSVATGG